MITGIRSAILTFCAFVPILLLSQENVTTLGLQIKPILVSDIGGAGPFEVANGPYRLSIEPRTGLSFGMVIRQGLTKNISAEVGLNRVVRQYDYAFTDEETGFQRTLDFGYVNYEIPLKGLVFIQLGERLFMNTGLGPSIDLFASDVGSGDLELEQITLRGQWAKIALDANLGFEYRTRKSGYIYLGASFHNPFSAVAKSKVTYRTSTEQNDVIFDLNAGYLTFDIKYYFHEDPERK
ncbi:MAG: hypothetical protein HKN79_00120 [Flavobacteriales bacterium]|nr:hypothetical protein [Flavobacteriales bacterium]